MSIPPAVTDEVLEIFQRAVRAAAMKCGANWWDAQDLSQDACVKLLRSPTEYRPTVTLGTMMGQQLSRDLWKKRRREYPLKYLLPEGLAEEEPWLEEEDTAENLERVRQAIGKDKYAYILDYYRKAPMKENENTVKVRAYKIRKEARQALNGG